MAPPATQSLTPSTKTPTDVPFPKRPAISKDGRENKYFPQLGTEADQKITIETCSELLKRKFPLDLFSVRQDNRADGLAIIHDKGGQPVVFSIGSDHSLYMLAFVNHASEGWQKFDITPNAAKGRKLVDFDVARFGADVYIAVAVPSKSGTEGSKEDDETTHSLWYCAFPVFEFGVPQSGQGVSGFGADDLKWSEVKNNLGAKHISTVVCGTGASIQGSASGLWLGVGTAATKSEPTANYIVDLSPGATAPWEPVPTVIPASESKSICPVMTGNLKDDFRVPGVASLLKRSAGGSSGIYVDTFVGPQRNRIAKQLLSGTLSDIQSFYANATVYGPHDIYAASDAGVGYYSFDNLGQEPTILLPGIPMRQVSCAEVLNDQYETNPEIYARLSVLAVSENDELYFIQGVRKDDGIVYFDAYSGLPIRTKVQKMSAQYNYGCRSTEILYTSKDRPNELHHLVRDPHTTLWSETNVTVRAVNEKPKFVERSVYVTTITLSNGGDTPVPDGYPIVITGSRVAVTVGTSSVFLSEKEIKLETSGGNGQIMVTAPADDLIGASEYRIQLTEFVPATSTSAKMTVQPSQRVLRLMSDVKSGDDLKNVIDKDGKPVFANLDSDKLSKMASVIGAANEATSPQPKTASTPTTVTTTGSKDDAALFDPVHASAHTSSRASGFSGWLGDAVDSTVHFFGDVVEAIKHGVKTIVKAGLQVLGKVLKFAVEIAGKVFSFAMKGVGLVLKGVSACLKLIGVDTSKLDAWLSYLFDGTATKETQKVLKSIVTGCITVSTRFLAVNENSVKDLFADGRTFLKKYIDDPRSPSEKAEGQKDSLLMKVFNNPIVQTLLSFNPLSWILDAFTDGLDAARFKMPDLQKFIERVAKHVGDGAESLVTGLTNAFSNIANSLGDLASDPSRAMSVLGKALQGVFWTLFDTIESLSLNIYHLLVDVFDLIVEFLTGEWEIPGLTDAWVEFTGQKFTLLGFGTYMCAALLNLGSMLAVGRLPFKDVQVFDGWEQLQVPQLYKSSSHMTSRRIAADSEPLLPAPVEVVEDFGAKDNLVHDLSVQETSPEKMSSEKLQMQAMEYRAPAPEFVLSKQELSSEVVPSKGHIFHKEASQLSASTSSPQAAKDRKFAAAIVGAVGEAFTFLAAAKEIFHLVDFTDPIKKGSSGGKDTLPNVHKSDLPVPKKGALDVLYNMTHLSAFAFAIVSTSCNVTYTVLRYNDDPPVPRGLLATSSVLSLVGCGLFGFKHDAAGGLLQQIASGTAIIAEWSNEAWSADHWPHHALEVTHFIAACTGFVGIVAADVKMEQVAVVCGLGDLTLSAVGGIGEIGVAVKDYTSH